MWLQGMGVGPRPPLLVTFDPREVGLGQAVDEHHQPAGGSGERLLQRTSIRDDVLAPVTQCHREGQRAAGLIQPVADQGVKRGQHLGACRRTGHRRPAGPRCQEGSDGVARRLAERWNRAVSALREGIVDGPNRRPEPTCSTEGAGGDGLVYLLRPPR